jgi:hypothetical protein
MSDERLTIWIRPDRRHPWARFATVGSLRAANDLIAAVVPNHAEVFVCEADRDVNAEEAEGRARERRRHASLRERQQGDSVA